MFHLYASNVVRNFFSALLESVSSIRAFSHSSAYASGQSACSPTFFTKMVSDLVAMDPYNFKFYIFITRLPELDPDSSGFSFKFLTNLKQVPRSKADTLLCHSGLPDGFFSNQKSKFG
jgi:hypothetical protein